MSQFGHVPAIGHLTAVPLAVLTVIALGLAGAGLIGLRQREIS